MAKLIEIGVKIPASVPEGSPLELVYPTAYVVAARAAGGMFEGRAGPLESDGWRRALAKTGSSVMQAYGGEVGDPLPPLVQLRVKPRGAGIKGVGWHIEGHPRDTGGGAWDGSRYGALPDDVMVTAGQLQSLSTMLAKGEQQQTQTQQALAEVAQNTELMQQAAGVGRVKDEAALVGKPANPDGTPRVYELTSTDERLEWDGTDIVPGSRGPMLAAARPLHHADVAAMLASADPSLRHWAGGRAGGMFDLLPAGDATPVDGGVVLQRADGRRLQRANVTVVKAHWFGLYKDGVTDSTARLQAALDYCKSQGGGIVKVDPAPLGYVIAGQIVVPAGVLLVGTDHIQQQQTALDMALPGGCRLLFTGTSQTPIVTEYTNHDNTYNASGGSGVTGFVFEYPNQDPANIKPYPPTVTLGLNAYDFSLTNIYCVNVYQLLDGENPHGRLQVSGIRGCVLSRGLTLDWGMDVDYLDDIHFAPIWLNSFHPDYLKVFEYLYANFIPLTTYSLDNLMIGQFSAFAFKTGWLQPRQSARWLGNTGYSRGEAGPASTYAQVGTMMLDNGRDGVIEVHSVHPNGTTISNLFGCVLPDSTAAVLRFTADMSNDVDRQGSYTVNSGSLWGGPSPVHVEGAHVRLRLGTQISWNNGPASAGVTVSGGADADVWLNATPFSTMGGNSDSDPAPTEISLLLADMGKARIYVENPSPANNREAINVYRNGKGQARVKLNGRWGEMLPTAAVTSYGAFANRSMDEQAVTLLYTVSLDSGDCKLFAEVIAPGGAWTRVYAQTHQGSGDYTARIVVPAGYDWRWILPPAVAVSQQFTVQ